MARTMLCESNLLKYFWTEAINTACYILNCALIRPVLKKITYELWKGRKPNIGYFHVFGCRCFILNNGKSNLYKFDSKSNEEIFLGYSLHSRVFRVFNKKTLVVEESIHVIFDESNDLPLRKRKGINDADEIEDQLKEITLKDKDESSTQETNEEGNADLPKASQGNNELERGWRYVHSHPKDQIIGDLSQGIRTKSSFRDAYNNLAFVSKIEPKCYDEAKNDIDWINAMHDELNQFERNNVWILVDRPHDHPIIGTKWVFRNKLDKHGNIIRNKARLVAKDYN